MDLTQAADLVQVLSGLTIVGGALFGVVQLRELKQQRYGAAAYAFFQQWDSERSDDLDIVYGLPDAAAYDVIEGDPKVRLAANHVYMNFEQLGMLVHGKIITLANADEWAGGAVRVGWRKLKPWIEAKRTRAGSQRPGEWFQWLAERLGERRVRDETVGAHQAYAQWRE
jgi:hypothetical protein